jgi:hypothetical protein
MKNCLVAVPVPSSSVVSPQAIHGTEGGNAAFCAYACSGENEDAVGGGNGEHQWKFIEAQRSKLFPGT